MKSEVGQKPFKVMPWLRETRDRIHEETRDMSFDEKRRWTEERIRRDPFLAALYDRRTTPTGRGAVARAAGGRAHAEEG